MCGRVCERHATIHRIEIIWFIATFLYSIFVCFFSITAAANVNITYDMIISWALFWHSRFSYFLLLWRDSVQLTNECIGKNGVQHANGLLFIVGMSSNWKAFFSFLSLFGKNTADVDNFSYSHADLWIYMLCTWMCLRVIKIEPFDLYNQQKNERKREKSENRRREHEWDM